MLENSDLASFHSKKGYSKKGYSKKDHSKNDVFEKWSTAFDESCDMEDVSDLEFFIVHPVDKKNDAKIKVAEDFWMQFLMDKGLDEAAFHFDTGIDG